MIEIPKSEWGDGPWQDEPDTEIWVDPDTDFPCLLHRHGGTWCGYVGVPPMHPADGLSYYKGDYDIEEVESGEAAELLLAQKAINNISVHGGLTFAGKRDWLFPERARCRDWHFFGFDCNHAGDFDPLISAYWRKNGHLEWANDLGKPTGWGGVIEYRDYAYAKAEVTSLAAQLVVIR